MVLDGLAHLPFERLGQADPEILLLKTALLLDLALAKRTGDLC